MSAPSAFSDSPEDLIFKAAKLIDEGSVSGKNAILIGELARALERERQSRASQFSAVRAANVSEGSMGTELAALKKSTSLRNLRRWQIAAIASWVLAFASLALTYVHP